MDNINANSSGSDDMMRNGQSQESRPMNDFQISLMHIANNFDRTKPLIQKMRSSCHPGTEFEGAIHVQERLYCFMKLRPWQVLSRIILCLTLFLTVLFIWGESLSLDSKSLSFLFIVLECIAAVWLISWLYTTIELKVLTKKDPHKIHWRYSKGLFIRGHLIVPLILSAILTILLIKFKFQWLAVF